MKVVEWSVSSRDWTNPGVDVIVQRTVSGVKNGSIILLHDGDGTAQKASREQTVEATRLIIRELSAQGYKFVTVNEIQTKAEE
jgi:peptidoglycan-N-acetylglucosamine deacetylase